MPIQLLKAMSSNPTEHQKTILKKALNKEDTLDLQKNELRDADVINLSESLKTNTTVTYLNLSENCITPESLSALGEMLCTNKTLLHLNLSGNEIGPKAVHLIEALQNNSTLQVLCLYNIGLVINKACAQKISDALRNNIMLRRLDLSNYPGRTCHKNSMDETSLEPLALLLEKNHTVIDLLVPNLSIIYDNDAHMAYVKILYCLRRNLEEHKKNTLEKVYGEAVSFHLPPREVNIVSEYLGVDVSSEIFQKAVIFGQTKAAERAQQQAKELADKAIKQPLKK